jgi:hypothetical protein
MARPESRDAKARTSAFLCAIADGRDAVTAAKDAKLDPWRALRIVTETDFNDVVRAIRLGLADVVAVELDADPGELAA